MILPTAHSSSLIQPSAQQPPSSPRGRKRQMEANDSFTHLQKRHSHSDVSDDDFGSHKSHSPSLDDDRRAHHNELERRRRDHIKDHFHSLKEVIPLLDGEKSSRALILKRAVEYISHMQSTLNKNQVTIEELQKRNQELSSEILEKEKNHTPTSTQKLASVALDPIPMSSVPTTSVALPFLYSLPIESGTKVMLSDSCSMATSPSSFTPVAPKLDACNQSTVPSLNDLALYLGLKPDQLSSLQSEASLYPDLQRLLSLNSLSINNPYPCLSSLLF